MTTSQKNQANILLTYLAQKIQGKRMKLYLADLQKITNHKHQNSKPVQRRRAETDKYQIQNFNEQKLMIIAYIVGKQLVIY